MVDYPTDIPEHVSRMFEYLTLKVYDRGIRRYSATTIVNQIRWHYTIEQGDEHFKINNNYTARLARWVMKKHTKLLYANPHGVVTRNVRSKRPEPQTGFFEIREGAEKKHDMTGWLPTHVE